MTLVALFTVALRQAAVSQIALVVRHPMPINTSAWYFVGAQLVKCPHASYYVGSMNMETMLRAFAPRVTLVVPLRTEAMKS